MVEIAYQRIESLLACPHCGGGIVVHDGQTALATTCRGCGAAYPFRDGILSFCREDDAYWQQVFARASCSAKVAVQNGYNSNNFAVVKKAVRTILGRKQGALILDAGCGTGAMMEPYAVHNFVVGVDFTFNSLKYAKANRLIPLHAQATQMPLVKERFDIVTAIEFITHLDDDLSAVRMLAGYVKPGGVLLLSGLNAHSIQRKIYRKILRVIYPGVTFQRVLDPIVYAELLQSKGYAVRIFYTIFPFHKLIHAGGNRFTRKPLATNWFITAQKSTANVRQEAERNIEAKN